MLEKTAQQIAESVKKSVTAATQALFAKLDPRIEALEKNVVDAESVKELILNAIKELESQMESAVQKAVSDQIALIPPATPGKDGESITLEDVAPLIETAVKEAFALIPAPEDGKSVDMADVKALVDAAVAAIPPAKDGESIPVETVEAMVAAQVEKAMASIKPPEVKDGRDALDIEIQPSIDEEKSYPRGVYATHRGGLWKSWKQTDGMNGWECVVDGVFKTVVTQEDERNFSFISEKSSGSIVKLPFYIPAMIYKKVYQDGREYKKGDTVTWAGSMWHCDKDTISKPGDGSEDWTLSAKKGRDAVTKVKLP